MAPDPKPLPSNWPFPPKLLSYPPTPHFRATTQSPPPAPDAEAAPF